MDLPQFSLESLCITGLLKEGYFSCVHLARYETKKENCTTEPDDLQQKNIKTVVVKIFKGETPPSRLVDDIIFIENIIGNNENIIEIIGYFIEPNLNIKGYAMNYEAFTIRGRVINDLHTYLVFIRENFTTPEDLEDDCTITFSPHDEELHTSAIQIAKACEYLHIHRIVHGNLSTRNVLLDQNKNIKLTDFGLLDLKESINREVVNKSANRSKFSCRWSSPECPAPGPCSTRESDVWSFGVVLWEIGTLGGLPFRNYTIDALENIRIRCSNDPPLEIENGTWELKTLIQSCLKKMPEERPDFQSITEELTGMNCLTTKHVECNLYNSLKLFDRYNLLPTKKKRDPDNTSSDFLNLHWKCLDPVMSLGFGTFGYASLLYLKNKETSFYGFVVEKKFRKYFSQKGESFQYEIKDIFSKARNHPNVAKIIATYSFEKSLLMEYQSIVVNDYTEHLRGLRQYLHHLRQEVMNGDNVDSHELGWFSLQIARGMAHLHRKKIVHGNLAARNVLINNAKILKITDYFAYGKGSYLNPPDRKNLPPCRWASPELIRSGQFTFQSDVWAFGVVLWEIATLGACPYSGFNSDQLIERLAKAEVVLNRTDNISQELWVFMTKCWDVDPLKRPEFKTIESLLLSSTSRRALFLQFEMQEDAEDLVNFLPMVENEPWEFTRLSRSRSRSRSGMEQSSPEMEQSSHPQHPQSSPPERQIYGAPSKVRRALLSKCTSTATQTQPSNINPSPLWIPPFQSPESLGGGHSESCMVTSFLFPEESPNSGHNMPHVITSFESPTLPNGGGSIMPYMAIPFQFPESPGSGHNIPHMATSYQSPETPGEAISIPQTTDSSQPSEPPGDDNSIPQKVITFQSIEPPGGGHNSPQMAASSQISETPSDGSNMPQMVTSFQPIEPPGCGNNNPQITASFQPPGGGYSLPLMGNNLLALAPPTAHYSMPCMPTPVQPPVGRSIIPQMANAIKPPEPSGGGYSMPHITTTFLVPSPPSGYYVPCMPTPLQPPEPPGSGYSVPYMSTPFPPHAPPANNYNTPCMPTPFLSPERPGGSHGAPQNVFAPFSPISPTRPIYYRQGESNSAHQSPQYVSQEPAGMPYLQNAMSGLSLQKQEYNPHVYYPSNMHICSQRVQEQIIVSEMHNPVIQLPWQNLQPLMPTKNLHPLPSRYCATCNTWTNFPNNCHCVPNMN